MNDPYEKVKENVVGHLQIMHTWASFALEKDINFFSDKHIEHIKEWTNDTLKLLDEQETEIRQLKLALQILKGEGIIVRKKVGEKHESNN